MAALRQFVLLIWKNFLLQKRHPLATLFEIGVPTLFAILLMVIRTRVDSESFNTATDYRSFSVDEVPKDLPQILNDDKLSYRTIQFPVQPTIYYSPNHSHIVDVMNRVEKSLPIKIKGFESEEQILELLASNKYDSSFGGAVIFKNEIKNLNFTNKISFKIRLKATPSTSKSNPNSPLPTWNTRLSFPAFPGVGPREKTSSYGGAPGYMKEGFLTLQHHVSLAITEFMTSKSLSETFDLKLKRYPYPPYVADNFMLALQFFFPLVLMLSFIYPALNIVKNIVIEKERRLKESMKMMGLSNWLHWTAWFLKYLIFLMFSIAITTIVLTAKVINNLAVLDKINPLLLFVFLLVYTISTISFCFLISVLFSKANSAAAAAGVLFFLAFVPYFILVQRYDTLSHMEKVGSCLLSNTALSLGAMVISKWEGNGAGANWSNLSTPTSQDDTITLQLVIGMMLLDSLIYLILTWYIEAVYPGEFGVAQPWYFPVTKTYWCGSSLDSEGMLPLESTEKESDYFEKDPVGLMPGVHVMGLTKVFKKNKVAVNNVNLTLYKGQITALLGHNGAGKTTTISMLTGLFPPTSGTATVNGYDIEDDIEGVHSSLGICPQHDILFDELTVEEHLYFFCKLKGYLSDLVKSEIDRMISVLKLEDKRHVLSKNLSGGMKRKLSVGMALVGGSQVVMLDEPTSGMDPAARRFTWDLLQSEKEDRTILLTTHFMEEADILGDRIAIMANGEVQCCGSPLYLKKQYGAGYHLVMVKGQGCNVEAVTELIYQHVPSAEMESNMGAELSFSLPHNSSDKFSALFDQLQKNQEKLGISSFGASITTMEEVFLRVGEYSQTAMKKINPAGQSTSSLDGESTSMLVENKLNNLFNKSSTSGHMMDISGMQYQRNQDFHLFCQQFVALFYKRVLHTYRHWLLTLCQVMLPVLYLTITFVILKTLPKPEDSPERILNLQPFRGTTVPYLLNNKIDLFWKDAFISQLHTVDKPVRVPFGNDTIETMVDYLIKKGIEDLPYYNMHNMIAAVFDQNETHSTFTSLFNNQGFHTPAIALASMDNAILKFFTNNTKNNLEVSNHPLPRTIAEKTKQQANQGTEAYQISQDLMFAMSFLMASFAIFLVKERSTKAKHLQRVSGVNLILFWGTTYLWDFINFIIPCLLVLGVTEAFQTEALIGFEQRGRLFLLFVLYGLCGLPFIYCLSFLFQVSSTAYTRLCLFNIIAGIGTLLSVTILEIPLLELEYIAKPLDWVFSLVFPHYCLGRATYNLYQNYQFLKFCNTPTIQGICKTAQFELVKPCCVGKCGDECVDWKSDYLDWETPGIGRLLVFLFFQILIYNFLLFACEQNLFRKLKYFFCQKKISPTVINQNNSRGENFLGSTESGMNPEASQQNLLLVEDEDVLEETNRILQTPLGELQSSDSIIIRDLSKTYGSLVAVDKISLGIKKGECFGLLGLNGAGKTTTFKMLTGDEIVTSGNAYMDGFSVKTDIRYVQQRIGYCPQFDAVIDLMTGRETLTMFARLRGVPEALIPSQVDYLGTLLYFDMHLDKLVKDFSGGNKRKLSTAVALVGDSPIVFLDEPTTGMDPVARRCLWDAIVKIIQMGRSVILTSHSMEECEALCNRLVIMVNGRFCCLGSPQHLKNKFGQGFTLLIKVGRYNVMALQNQAPNSSPVNPPFASINTSKDDEHSPEVEEIQQVPLKFDNFKTRVDEIKSYFEETFPNCVLKSVHQGLLHYHISDPQYTWAQMFDTMEKAKLRFNIENYSVGQTTLEQVFLNFSRTQRQSISS